MRLIERYHDPKPGAMIQIVLAPCSPFSVTGELMRQSAALARQYGVHLHTHLAETQDEEAFCLQKFGYRPVAYMQSVDWIGPDVWFAHSVHVNQAEIELYARTGCGVAHCPSSNMRLASGIAPVREYMRGRRQGGAGRGWLGQQRWLAHAGRSAPGHAAGPPARRARRRIAFRRGAPPLLTARQALELATRGGAAVLGRSDIGSLEPGKCADFFAINLDRLDYAGALHDPVAALVFCAPQHVDCNVVGGKMIVQDGQLDDRGRATAGRETQSGRQTLVEWIV